MSKPAFLTVDRTVFIIKHKDGYVSDTAKGTFKVTETREEAKRYISWQAVLKMAQECGAEEIQEVDADNCNTVTRRYEVRRAT